MDFSFFLLLFLFLTPIPQKQKNLMCFSCAVALGGNSAVAQLLLVGAENLFLIEELAVFSLGSLSVGRSCVQVGFPGLLVLLAQSSQGLCWAGSIKCIAGRATCAPTSLLSSSDGFGRAWKGPTFGPEPVLCHTTKLANPHGSWKAWKCDVERRLCRKCSWVIPSSGGFHATAIPWMALYNPKITTCTFPQPSNLPKNHHFSLDF